MRIKFYFCFLLLLPFLAGCGYLAPSMAKLTDAGGEAIAEYCANMPASERPETKAALEASCNEHANGTGCEIELTCPTPAE